MDRIFDVILVAFVVGGILVLVRPGSQGPALVEAGGGKIVALAQAVTGGGTWWSK